MSGFQKSGSQPCFYCGQLAEGYDHVVPRRSGGADAGHNLVPACVRCNSRKGTMSIEEFRLYVGLMDGRIPVSFYGENLQQPKRDWLHVASKRRRADLFAYNRMSP